MSLCRLESITQHFMGRKALSDVRFDIRPRIIS